MITLDSLEGFEERTEQLSKVWRYNNYPVVFYRSDVWTHSKRIYFLVKETLPFVKSIFPNFNADKALAMALVHDDAEIITGDIVAGKKAKFNSYQQQEYDLNEQTAIEIISKRNPKFLGEYEYRGLLLEVDQKKTIESQVVKYLDRFDALCEATHELIAGNHEFGRAQTSDFGLLELPTEYYVKRFNEWRKNYPLLENLIETNTLPFTLYGSISINDLLNNPQLFDSKRILKKKNIVYYDWWVEVMNKNLSREDFSKLYTQKETY